jgi:hypothetical protein
VERGNSLIPRIWNKRSSSPWWAKDENTRRWQYMVSPKAIRSYLLILRKVITPPLGGRMGSDELFRVVDNHPVAVLAVSTIVVLTLMKIFNQLN